MTAPTPPFRADHVGSLLRPERVKQARKSYYQDRTITRAELTDCEDVQILRLLHRQEQIGLKAATDGEARRSFWHYDFLGALDGLDLVERGEGVAFAGKRLRPVFPTITGKLGFPEGHPMLDHFAYLRDHTNLVPKMSIPGPSTAHFRTAPGDIAPSDYADPEALFADIAATWRAAVRAFYDAGCRYLQLDDIFFAYLCDPKHRAEKAAAGMDPDWLIERYAWMMREATRDRPEDMVIAMHMCRGNFRSTHAAEGAYDAVADTVFNRTGVDVFFMEYDTDRAGGLEPLRFLARGRQRVMAGFVTTKRAELESLDDLRRRFDEASKYADLDQLGIAPQCGFASTEEGNEITEDDQWRKLELVVKCAESIWGGV